jgi:hypothetical protein
MEATGDKFDIHGVDQPRKGTDWGKILRAANIGFTDMGNALSDNRNAQGGGAIYDLNKAQMAEEQVAKLRTRQSMFDESFKVSQTLPPEVLTDPQFAELKQAKDALDADAADGQIDNEKTVAAFNLAFQRAKHTLLSKEAMRKDTEQLESNKRMAGGNLELALGQRGDLERIAADPTNPMSQAAQQELAKQKLTDIQSRNVGGQDVSMSASDWAKRDLDVNDPWKKRELDIREQGIQSAAADRRENRADRDAYRSQGALGSMLESSMRRYGKADESGELLNAPEAMAAALVENEDAILQAAQRAGVQVGGDENIMVVNGRQFAKNDPKQLAAGLQLLYQITRTY